jgi:hypothetical protein
MGRIVRKLPCVIFKATFPEIHVGSDRSEPGRPLRYFGSYHNDRVEADFSTDQLGDFTLRKEILFESYVKTEAARVEGMQACRHPLEASKMCFDPEVSNAAAHVYRGG